MATREAPRSTRARPPDRTCPSEHPALVLFQGADTDHVDLDRFSPRFRARWMSVAGVIAATSCIGIGTFSLTSDVLPFDAWPGRSDHAEGQQLLPAAASVSRAAQSGS